ncbi:MAG TPA: DUF2007 domain-containing protein [Caulobacteraceae bacterium]|jgi:hypothetical protein
MIALVTTIDPVKLGAVRALLAGEGIETEVFDAAAGALWRAVIPMRLMVARADGDSARRVLREAGFVEAADGDWDLKVR